MKQIIIIGGGAAGFFAAINLAKRRPDLKITILEKTTKLLSKVKVSGGGRCNVTNYCLDNSELAKNYPRGNKELLQIFAQFNVKDTINWFEENGVKLKAEEDHRMFPVTNSSETIIDCFLRLAHQLKVEIITQCEVFSIKSWGDGFKIKTSVKEFTAGFIIYATGGNNKSEAYHLIKNLGHTIEDPIPSLFTFNLPDESIKKELQGISVNEALVKISGTKLSYHGPLLITHWGFSGPAILKLSAYAAKLFHEMNYYAGISVNWIYPNSISETEIVIRQVQKQKYKSLPFTQALFDLPKRLWEFLCITSGIDNSKSWAELSNKQINKLCEAICNSHYQMEGKTTFKEEFVTCGGVNLKEIDFKTMQSKIVPGLFFCGEVINIDGITGGFNFQNAWSTSWVSAKSVGEKA